MNQGQRTFDGSESLLRLGLASKTELRLTVPDYFDQSGAPSGFGDLITGMKRQVGFDSSLSLPTGARAISSHGYDPFAQLAVVSGGVYKLDSPGDAVRMLANARRPPQRHGRDHLPHEPSVG